MLADPATRWRTLTVPGWCGEGECAVEVATGTCVWHHAGLPAVSLGLTQKSA